MNARSVCFFVLFMVLFASNSFIAHAIDPEESILSLAQYHKHGFSLGPDGMENCFDNMIDPNGDGNPNDRLYDIVLHSHILDHFSSTVSDDVQHWVDYIILAQQHDVKVGVEWNFFPFHGGNEGGGGSYTDLEGLYLFDRADGAPYSPPLCPVQYLAEDMDLVTGEFVRCGDPDPDGDHHFYMDIANSDAVNLLLSRIDDFMEHYYTDHGVSLDYFYFGETSLQKPDRRYGWPSAFRHLYYFDSPTYSAASLTHYQNWLNDQRTINGANFILPYEGDQDSFYFPVLAPSIGGPATQIWIENGRRTAHFAEDSNAWNLWTQWRYELFGGFIATIIERLKQHDPNIKIVYRNVVNWFNQTFDGRAYYYDFNGNFCVPETDYLTITLDRGPNIKYIDAACNELGVYVDIYSAGYTYNTHYDLTRMYAARFYKEVRDANNLRLPGVFKAKVGWHLRPQAQWSGYFNGMNKNIFRTQFSQAKNYGHEVIHMWEGGVIVPGNSSDEAMNLIDMNWLWRTLNTDFGSVEVVNRYEHPQDSWILNSGIENGEGGEPSNWTAVGNAIFLWSDDGYQSAKSLMIEGNGSANGWSYWESDPIFADHGETYNLNISIKTELMSEYSEQATFRLRWYNEKDEFISAEPIDSVTGVNEWNTYPLDTILHQPPCGSLYGKVLASYYTLGGTGKVWFDRVYLNGEGVGDFYNIDPWTIFNPDSIPGDPNPEESAPVAVFTPEGVRLAGFFSNTGNTDCTSYTIASGHLGTISSEIAEKLVVAPSQPPDVDLEIYSYLGDGQKTNDVIISEPYGGYNGGANLAIGDLDNDGVTEIVMGAVKDGGPLVKVFDMNGTLKYEFWAYQSNFRGGVFVACGDVDADGKDEIITGPGPNIFDGIVPVGYVLGPLVRVWDVENLESGYTYQFYAYGADFQNGVNVACGNIDDNLVLSDAEEIITGAGPGWSGSSNVRAFYFTPVMGGRYFPLPNVNFFAFGFSFEGGVYVGTGDFNADGLDEIIAGAGQGNFESKSEFKRLMVYDQNGELFENNLYGSQTIEFNPFGDDDISAIRAIGGNMNFTALNYPDSGEYGYPIEEIIVCKNRK